MTVVQLQLDLWQQLEQAQVQPQATDWQQLCLAFDEAIDRTPVGQQLATAADAISQMADVLAARAVAFGADWCRKPGDGPVMDFSEFVRQSLSLDLSDLVAVPELYVRSPSGKDHGDGESVVVEVSKEALLGLIEPESRLESVPVLELEHDEDVGAWIGAITQCLQGQSKWVGFTEILEGTEFTAGQVWLGVLLGGFKLHPTGGFYERLGLLVGLGKRKTSGKLYKFVGHLAGETKKFRVRKIVFNLASN